MMSEVDEAVRAVREEFEPSRSDRARVKRRLLARAASAGIVSSLAAKSSAGAAFASSPLAGQALVPLAKLFFGSMLATFVGVGAVVAMTRGVSTNATRRPPSSVISPAASTAVETPAAVPAALASSEPAVSRAPRAAPSLVAGSNPAPAATTEAPGGAPPASSDLEAELALLREARLASANGDLGHARSALDMLELRFPRGLLLEERVALRALTDCEASGTTARAAEFLRLHPTSVYAAKVRRSCHLETSPATSSTAAFTDSAGPGH